MSLQGIADLKSRIDKFDPFRPDFSFVAAFLAFLLIGQVQGLRLHPLTLAVLGLGLVMYLAGVILGKSSTRSKTLRVSMLSRAAVITLLLSPALVSSIIFRSVSMWVTLGLLASSLLLLWAGRYLLLQLSEPRLRSISIIAILVALALYAYNIVSLGGFPFSNEFTTFDYDLKLQASYSIARLVSISLFLLGSAALVVTSAPQKVQVKVTALSLGVIGSVAYGLLLGFRNQILRVVMVIFLACWYGKVIGKRALAILALASVPVALHFYRRSYDALFFFDQIVRLVGPSGRTFGSVLFTETGHTIVLQTILDLYFKRGSAGLEGLSATWMGPPYLDYGVLGVVWIMVWLGFLMGSTYEMMMYSRGILRSVMVVSYSFIWPHIMITIETGPALNTVLLLAFFTALNLVTIQFGDLFAN